MAGSQANAPEITIASLTTEKQFHEAVELQRTIWGFEDLDLLPFRFFVVAVKVGGQLFGAYDGSKMVAFCLAIPGLKPGAKPYLHSHMLGVLDGYRDFGLGRRMKLYQREDALARGIDLIEWTFDPLELKNAWFNIERLGAIVRRYVRNQYGMSSSHLQSGLPTDRCTAEWWLDAPRPTGPIAERISYPADIAQIRRADPKRAREIQAANAELFEDAFRRNLVVTGVERGDGTTSYLLSEVSA